MRQPDLDHESPVPLYHQLAEALRYQIATGVLPPGTLLPALRHAALLWGVNLHTVRRAYAALAEQSLVATRGVTGTRVLPPAGRARAGADAGRERFIARVLQEARSKHGIDAAELASLVHSRGARRLAPPGTAHVVECSRTQCEDLAAQLEARWRVAAVPWPLDRPDPPPPGFILATYFHYNDVRVRLAERLSDVRFAAISPDPALRGVLRRSRGRRAFGRLRVVLCDQDPTMARNIAADLSRILPADEFELTTEVTPRPEQWLERARLRAPVLFAPRMWGGLSETARTHPLVHEVRYVFDPNDLETIGRDLGWQAR
jgi:DNA-binding transcriptional regulator YhcF (GntR family)